MSACLLARAKKAIGASIRPIPLHRIRAEVLAECTRRLHVDECPPVDDGHAVAECLRLLDIVRCEEDSHATLCDLAHEIPDMPPDLRVERNRRLIEEEHLRAMNQGTRDQQPSLHPARETAHIIVAYLRKLHLCE